MRPETFRNRWGFSTIHAAPMVLLTAVPALSAPVVNAQFMQSAPLAIAVGALGFGALATLVMRKVRRDSQQAADAARQQLAAMRTTLDEHEALLEIMPELTIIWRDARQAPSVYGQGKAILPDGRPIGSVADFRTWLTPTDGEYLSRRVGALKNEARSFDTSMITLEGHLLRISGRTLGGAAIMRLRPAVSQQELQSEDELRQLADVAGAQSILSLLNRPAFIRSVDGTLTYANAAYWRIAEQLQVNTRPGDVPDIFDMSEVDGHLEQLVPNGDPATIDIELSDGRVCDLTLFAIEGGSAAILRQRPVAIPEPVSKPEINIPSGLEHIVGVIDAVATPIAVFDQSQKLQHFNKAYCEFWDLDAQWLKSGADEKAILNRLRTQGQLPSEVDYRAWRTQHLEAYTLSTPRMEPWYLPDGRTVNVKAVPLPEDSGVVYIFEDITERLALESRYNGLNHVQSETLNALSEGVAVFGTNGRLTLHNPRLSSVWKLPMNQLGQHPHIDDVASACALAMPEDGQQIWDNLKQGIVDLNPTRVDKSGRLTRADGRLIDYAITRLPDGQTMMTFVDVTESASYQRVLKERNDALVIADRLKDAFVQNVSYELRSPLTNIIGFADLLAADTAGTLNEKQRAYTEYIRSSSQSLGVLIDNILDLATADAGVAELRFEHLEIADLIERASAGVVGTLTAGESETPLKLSVDIQTNLPPFIADGTRIIQILYNLLSNAARFSEPGSEVKLTVSGRADWIIFTIEDEGVGITEEMKATLFQRFEGQSVEGRQRGAGLGLAIVRTFVNLHGGTISLERRDPVGTRVIVSIPANAEEVAGAAE